MSAVTVPLLCERAVRHAVPFERSSGHYTNFVCKYIGEQRSLPSVWWGGLRIVRGVEGILLQDCAACLISQSCIFDIVDLCFCFRCVGACYANGRCFGRVAEWQTRWLQVPVSFMDVGVQVPLRPPYAV